MNIDLLRNNMLFHGMTDTEIENALKKMNSTKKHFKKGAVILHAGDTTDKMGLVLDGSVTIESNDMWGNRTILSHVEKGQFFAETYALMNEEPLLVDVTANESCHILFLQIGSLKNIISIDSSWCNIFITNLLAISARKNLNLSGRSFHTSPKTIRGRVMSYLNSMALQYGSREFDIPFDRQQLADYLNVERTALSKELAKMQKDGIITVKKNRFKLIQSA